MSNQVQFTRDVTVDGTAYKAGDVVELDAIPTGYRDSCLRLGTCVSYVAPKPAEKAPDEPSLEEQVAEEPKVEKPADEPKAEESKADKPAKKK